MTILIKLPIRVLACALLATAVAGCGKFRLPMPSGAAAVRPVLDTDAQQKLIEEQRNQLIVRLQIKAQQRQFKEVVQLVEEKVGSPAEQLWPDENLRVGVVFDVDHEMVNQSITRWQSWLAGKGCYLFRLENNLGIDDASDLLALVPTMDVYEVILLVGTNGNGFEYKQKELTTLDIIDWLKELEKTTIFEITGVGAGFIEGKYLTRIKNPDQLADRIFRFSPDVVNAETGTMEELTNELNRGELCFLWE